MKNKKEILFEYLYACIPVFLIILLKLIEIIWFK